MKYTLWTIYYYYTSSTTYFCEWNKVMVSEMSIEHKKYNILWWCSCSFLFKCERGCYLWRQNCIAQANAHNAIAERSRFSMMMVFLSFVSTIFMAYLPHCIYHYHQAFIKLSLFKPIASVSTLLGFLADHST